MRVERRIVKTMGPGHEALNRGIGDILNREVRDASASADEGNRRGKRGAELGLDDVGGTPLPVDGLRDEQGPTPQNAQANALDRGEVKAVLPRQRENAVD